MHFLSNIPPLSLFAELVLHQVTQVCFKDVRSARRSKSDLFPVEGRADRNTPGGKNGFSQPYSHEMRPSRWQRHVSPEGGVTGHKMANCSYLRQCRGASCGPCSLGEYGERGKKPLQTTSPPNSRYSCIPLGCEEALLGEEGAEVRWWSWPLGGFL